jgi:tetratricopeptide (TPR) repeat protein
MKFGIVPQSLAVILLIGISIEVLAENKATEMTNNALGRSPTSIGVVDPAAYYANRVKALNLVRQENWKVAKPILEELTSQYQDDGDTWYVLGLTYLQHQQWKKAIRALEKTLELGTVLHGIPTGSAPSNDIMIKIAEAYGRLGDQKNALAWIHKSLAARWDDRPTLAGTSLFNRWKNPNFESFETSEAFQKSAGSYLDKTLSRDDAWRQDLHYLSDEIKRLHANMYHSVSAEAFQSNVSNIHKQIPSLTDQQVVFKFMELVGSLGNGHNFIFPVSGAKGSFSQIPIQFYWFSDGLYVVGASKEYQQWIGSKVEAFGNTPAAQALERTKTINPRDNEMQHRWLSPYYLSLTNVLEGLGIVDSSEEFTLTLSNISGVESIIQPTTNAMSFRGFPKLPPLAVAESPRYLVKNTDNYWSELITKSNTLYAQVNDIANKPSVSFKEFNLHLRNQIIKDRVDNLILDLRHNSGGDGSINPPMIATMVFFEAYNPEGKMFVLIGRNTFSAAHNLLLDVDRLTNVIIVGEPSGSRPNALSEAGWFSLPYSGLGGLISSQFHQPSEPEDHRIWVAPHMPINLSSDEYFSGKDPSIDAIFELIGNASDQEI